MRFTNSITQSGQNLKIVKERAGQIAGQIVRRFAGRIVAATFAVIAICGAISSLSLNAAAQNATAQHTENSADKTLRSSGRVNPSTLGMEFDVPLMSYPGRGISLPVGLNYSSKVWRMEFIRNDPLRGGGGEPIAGEAGEGEEGGGGLPEDGSGNPCVAVYEAKFAEDSAAGWTTTMQEAYVEYTGFDNRYNGIGFPIATAPECVPAIGTGDPNGSYIRRIQIHLPSGESHELRIDDENRTYPLANGSDANNPQFDHNWSDWYKATDGSNLKYRENRTNNAYYLLLPDGSRYDFDNPITTNSNNKTVRKATKFTDRHGNKITYNATPSADYPNGHWTDTLGRDIGVPLPRTAPVDPIIQEHKMRGLGNNWMIYKFHWKKLQGATAAESALTIFDGTTLKYLGDMDIYPSMGTYNGPSHKRAEGTYLFGSILDSVRNWAVDGSSTPFNPILLTAIELPNGQKYQFSYNDRAEIDRVIYPTSGEETFIYEKVHPLTQSQNPARSVLESNRGVKTRKVKESSSAAGYEWTYKADYVAPRGYKVSIVNPDGTRSERFLHQDKQECTGQYCTGDWGYGNGLAGMAYEERSFSAPPANKITSRTLRAWAVKTYPVSTYGVLATWHPRAPWEKNITYDEGGNGLATSTLTEFEGAASLETPLLPTKVTGYDFEKVMDGTTFQPGAQLTGTPAIPSVPATPASAVLKSAETVYLINDPAYSGVQTAYRDRNLVGLVTISRTRNAAGTIVAQSEIKYDDSDYLEGVNFSAPGWVNLGTYVRGLPTIVRVWDSTKGFDTNAAAYLQTHTSFDQFGNVRKSWDAKGNFSEIQYAAANHYAYPTTSIAPVTSFISTTNYDFFTGLPTSATDINGQTTVMSYADPVTGVTDPLLRLRKVTAPNGHQTITEYGAGTDALTRFVKNKTQIDETKWKEGFSWYDGLGRNYKTQSVDQSGAGDVFTETLFDEFGRTSMMSNPYRANETKQWTVTVYDKSSRMTEVISPLEAGQSTAAKVQTSYALATTTGAALGTVVTVTDQAGKKRRSLTNALGQLARVDEPNEQGEFEVSGVLYQATAYVYDELGNLETVTQGTQPARNFYYDSLSRLQSANNPESGTVSYTYDENGNLQTKRDDRGIKTVYDYDNLNRIVKRCYRVIGAGTLGLKTCAGNSEPLEPNSPEVAYVYDSLTNAKGKLIKVSSSVSTTEYTEFDQMGRVKKHKQTTDSKGYETLYTYNLSGALIEETYPSLRVVKNVLDADGDLSIVQSSKNATAGYWNYAKNFAYTAAGAVSSMQLGNGRWESTAFNNRLQPTQIALGGTPNATNLLKLNYEYGALNGSGQVIAGTNNGNVAKQTITVPTVGSTVGFTAVQNYTYDSVNRLKQASESLTPTGGSSATGYWQQTFDYDRWGNRTFIEANTSTLPKGCVINGIPTVCPTDVPIVNPSIDTTKNRLNGYTYDAAGNTTRDAQNKKFTYDGENKQTKVENVDANGTFISEIGQYYYDGDGKRVKKYVQGTGETTIFVYDASGKMVAEYSTIIEPAATAKVSYLTNDHLGSPRVITDQNGSIQSRRDFLTFGEDLYTTQRTITLGYQPDTVRQRFTGYEKDAESNLDFAQARMFGGSLGRFTTPDPYNIILEAGFVAQANPENARSMFNSYLSQPQQWNRYIYVNNNPLKYIDPTGKILKITGKYAAYIVKELERFTGYKLNRDKETGIVTIAESVDRKTKGTSENLAGKLSDVIGDKDSKIAFSTGTNQEETYFDRGTGLDKDGFRAADVDIADYKVFKKDAKEFAAASLGHILEEGLQYAKGAKGGEGHNAGLEFEAKVAGDILGRPQSFNEQEIIDDTTTRFSYSDVSYLVKNSKNDPNKITSVTREKR